MGSMEGAMEAIEGAMEARMEAMEAMEAPRRNKVNNNSNSIKSTPQKAPARKEFQTPRALSGNNSNNNRVNSNSSEDSSGQCPGDELEACIAVCPGFSARVFGACVAGCAKRCPTKK